MIKIIVILFVSSGICFCDTLSSGTFGAYHYGAGPLITTSPGFLIQPQSTSVAAESTATFNATISGSMPLDLQWYCKNAPISGANSTTLSINNCDVTNRGNYFLVITNLYGSATSQLVSLSVTMGANVIYVSNSGSDTNTGTTNFPIATIAMLETQNRTGKTNYFYAGDIWREQHFVTEKLLDWYGPTNLGYPVFTGATVLTNANFSLAAGKTYTYQYGIWPAYAPNPYMTSPSPHGSSNVLMVLDNRARLDNAGGNFLWDYNAGFGSVANVESNANSFWWDTNAGVLYIHTSDGSSPISNGRSYLACVRTLNLYGGDGSTVQHVQMEDAYAYDSNGSQGYQYLAENLLTNLVQYFVASGGWNHVVGVANRLQSDALTFQYGDVSDGEIGAVLCIAYKDSCSLPYPKVYFKHINAYQPSTASRSGVVAFESHSATAPSIATEVTDCTATNCSTAFNLSGDATTPSLLWKVWNCTAIDCDDALSYDCKETIVSNLYTWGCNRILNTRNTDPTNHQSIINSTFIGNKVNYFSLQHTNGFVSITNCVFAWTNNIGTVAAVNFAGGQQVDFIGNSVYGAGVTGFNSSPATTTTTNFLSSDYNNYYLLPHVAVNFPGNQTTLANWQTAYPALDSHSTATNPGYAASFFARPVVTDPSGP